MFAKLQITHRVEEDFCPQITKTITTLHYSLSLETRCHKSFTLHVLSNLFFRYLLWIFFSLCKAETKETFFFLQYNTHFTDSYFMLLAYAAQAQLIF